ncbi:unnamed protein product [Arctia plantaginis]|uniref:Uncharacterized protein n=1 Tax=Arctia plantaginis TaxID=874455 RepID=A0A8S0ZBY9_ARCPL|nr:unnamed protein product [Arctia plantaginis]
MSAIGKEKRIEIYLLHNINNLWVLAQDAEKLQFCAEVRWAERDNGAVWALSTRFHKFFRRSASKHEINIRILRVFDNNFVSVQSHFLRRSARQANATFV